MNFCIVFCTSKCVLLLGYNEIDDHLSNAKVFIDSRQTTNNFRLRTRCHSTVARTASTKQSPSTPLHMKQQTAEGAVFHMHCERDHLPALSQAAARIFTRPEPPEFYSKYELSTHVISINLQHCVIRIALSSWPAAGMSSKCEAVSIPAHRCNDMLAQLWAWKQERSKVPSAGNVLGTAQVQVHGIDTPFQVPSSFYLAAPHHNTVSSPN